MNYTSTDFVSNSTFRFHHRVVSSNTINLSSSTAISQWDKLANFATETQIQTSKVNATSNFNDASRIMITSVFFLLSTMPQGNMTGENIKQPIVTVSLHTKNKKTTSLIITGVFLTFLLFAWIFTRIRKVILLKRNTITRRYTPSREKMFQLRPEGMGNNKEDSKNQLGQRMQHHVRKNSRMPPNLKKEASSSEQNRVGMVRFASVNETFDATDENHRDEFSNTNTTTERNTDKSQRKTLLSTEKGDRKNELDTTVTTASNRGVLRRNRLDSIIFKGPEVIV